MSNPIRLSGNWICWLVGHWWQRTETYGERECARCLMRTDGAERYDSIVDARNKQAGGRWGTKDFIDPEPHRQDDFTL